MSTRRLSDSTLNLDPSEKRTDLHSACLHPRCSTAQFCDLYGVVELTWYTPWTYWHRDHFHAVDYEQFELTPCVLLLFEVHFAVELHSAVYSDALLTRGNGHPLLLLPMVDLVRLFCEQYLFFENEITH
ncbi:hypothetical protein C0J52_13457 [Blattella germanica]|nr:hypothetical protein C0J52_13457 [Blattella germanica]